MRWLNEISSIREEDEKVEIQIVSRNYPNSSDYWDGNWNVSKINAEILGYLVRFNADLRTDELRDFC